MEAPLVVIVGPTASGKSSLALRIAECYNGEIICADSRTIYKELSIGTAKPSDEERARVPHFGLDLVEPGQRFTAHDFKQYAETVIAEIRRRGHVPILVGGTGLYIDSIIFDYEFAPVDETVKKELQSLSLAQLYDYCISHDIILPENEKNPRHIVSTILRNGQPPKRRETPIENTFIVGIATEPEVLRRRIHERSENLFRDGMVDEAKAAGQKYGWDTEAMTGNIYPLVYAYLQGTMTEQELRSRFETSDWQLAKRQLTWLKRNPFIQWLPVEQASTYLTDHLAQFVQS